MSTMADGPPIAVSMPFLRRRGVQFGLLALISMIALYARVAVSPLQETIRVALGFTDNQIGLLQGPALSLPMVICAVPLGLLIDRCSRVRLLVFLGVAELIGSVLTAASPDFTLLFIARSVVGLAATATAITALSLLADLYEPAQRGRASMVIVIGQVVGMSAAFASGGALLSITGSGDWRRAMLWLSVPLVVAVLATLAMREPRRAGPIRGTARRLSLRVSVVALWHNEAVVMVLVGLVMAEIAAVVVPVWTAPALSRRFALAPHHVGAVMSVALLVSGISGPIIGGFLADLCQTAGGPRRTMLALAGVALLSAPAGIYAVVPEVEWASVLLVVFKTAISAMLVMSVALITVAVSNELRGFCLGVMGGMNNLFAGALAPLIVSLLSGAFGGATSLGAALSTVCVATGLLAAITFACGSRYFAHQ